MLVGNVEAAQAGSQSWPSAEGSTYSKLYGDAAALSQGETLGKSLYLSQS